MEAAAKTVEVLSQRILPEKPHHLSNNPEWRYRATSGDAKRFEEWHHPRLQYLTLVSEADRGVLMTRSYYDMREDPLQPPPREVNALAKGGEKKKLSLSDYKNKKTGATSTSPPEPAIAKKKESERAAVNAVNAVNTANAANAAAPPSAEARKPDRPKPREPEPPVDGKQRQPRELAVDMRLPPKPPIKHALPPRPPTPNIRKRVADVDEESRPQKRSKPDAGRSGAGAGAGDDRPPLPRDDAQRRKDRAPPATASRDAPSSAPPNGRAILKTAVGSGRNVSPASRSRGDSVNGVRPTVTGASRPAHTKPEASSKSFVPPLLSPLHLSFDSRDAEHASPPMPDKKKREDARDSGARSPKHRKAESVSGGKRQRSPARIPPLLSPTLPAVVEAALQLKTKTSLESLDGKVRDKDKDRDRDDRESPSKRKKPPVDYSDDDEPAPKTQRKTLVVTLKVPKKLRQSFKRMQALAASTAARKETQAQDHERAAAEEAPHPPPARKRPVTATDTPSETTALKRPRTSDIPTSSRPPSTPSKKGTTAMSRVSSSNSLAQTPGDTVNATPSAADTADRRTNGQDSLKPEKPEAKAMRDKEMRFSTLGRRLKHDADVMMQGGRRSPSANSKSREPNPKLGYVLCLESLLAFMAGFQAQNIYRGLCNKRSDPTGWASLFPFIEFLQKEIRRHEVQSRRYLPLYALLLLLHATAIDELIKCYTALENPSVGLADLLRVERIRTRTWPQIREANAVIDNPSLRVDITPWASLDEITLSSIRILRRWCADEDVDWVPDAGLKEPVAPKSTLGQNTRT